MPPQRPKPEVRQRFLDAAHALFEARGFRDASLRDVAARAGGSLGNLRAYFPTKDALFEAICGAVADEIDLAIAQARALPMYRAQTQPRQTDHLLVQSVVTYVIEHRPALWLLLERSAGSARAGWRERVQHAYVALEIHRLETYVAAHRDRFTRVPSSELVRAICRMYLGLTEDFIRGELDEATFRRAVDELDAFRHAGTTVFQLEEP
ncbi:MAG: helix-turn-helix domain-containing protein [Myxococcota bacterium]